jgi:hypothetical protein
VVDYTAYVSKYMNQRNPATGMFWLQTDIAAKEGMTLASLQEMLNRAQTANLIAVEGGRPPLSNQELMAAPPAADLLLERQKQIDNVVAQGPQGNYYFTDQEQPAADAGGGSSILPLALVAAGILFS